MNTYISKNVKWDGLLLALPGLMSNTKEVPLLVPSDFHSSLPKVPPFATNKQVVTSPLGTLVLPNGSNMTIQVGSDKKIKILTLIMKKSRFDNSVIIECGIKDVKIYFIGLKKRLVWVFLE